MPVLQRAGAALADRLAGFCMQWLSGEDTRMARAAAQVMGVFAEVEGARFGRRVPGLLQAISPALERAAQEVWCPSKCKCKGKNECMPVSIAQPCNSMKGFGQGQGVRPRHDVTVQNDGDEQECPFRLSHEPTLLALTAWADVQTKASVCSCNCQPEADRRPSVITLH